MRYAMLLFFNPRFACSCTCSVHVFGGRGWISEVNSFRAQRNPSMRALLGPRSEKPRKEDLARGKSSPTPATRNRTHRGEKPSRAKTSHLAMGLFLGKSHWEGTERYCCCVDPQPEVVR